MICENKKNNENCKGRIKGKIKYAKGMKVCDSCHYKLNKEIKNETNKKTN